MEEDSSSSSSEDEDTEEQSQTESPLTRAPTSLEPPRQDNVIIKKDYDPKQAKGPVKQVLKPAGPEEYTISPITGERIPVSKLHEHVRIGLLDPRWKDQRDRQLLEKVNQESVYAPGSLAQFLVLDFIILLTCFFYIFTGFAIDESLKQLAERRSDIFGTGVEETAIGKKHGEDERIPGMPWEPTSGLPSSAPNQQEERMDERKEQIGPTYVVDFNYFITVLTHSHSTN